MKNNYNLLETIACFGIFSASLTVYVCFAQNRNKALDDSLYEENKQESWTDAQGGYEALIGNTPLVRLDKLSKLVRCNIWIKMESFNPGGTGKDRAALAMLKKAESHLVTHVVEGTSGSTGIALAALCASRGYKLTIVMPDDQAKEKQQLLRQMGATVEVVPNCAISNPNHYVNTARRIAEKLNQIQGVRAVFMNQFENEANWRAHYTTTGPEIYRQTKGNLDAFVMSSGTGGTISGVGKYLKEHSIKPIKVVLVDPPGSSLYAKVKFGVAYTSQQRERTLKRHRYDTIAEGIGLDRVTANFSVAVDNNLIDDAIQVSDQEAVDMAHWLLREEGLFVGSSSAMNVVGAVQTAKIFQDHQANIVTLICDSGQRHMTRFWNPQFIKESGLIWPGDTNTNAHTTSENEETSTPVTPQCLQGLS